MIATVKAPMNTGEVIAAVLAVVQIAAIAVGSLWAYYKFVRGRTFHRRAELKVSLVHLRHGRDGDVLRAQVDFVNTGGSDIPLRAKIVRTAAFTGDTDNKGRAVWAEAANAPLFVDHEWIESSETIRDDLLVPLPASHADAVAYRATAIVYERRRRRWAVLKPKSGGVKWTAHSITTPAALAVDGEEV